MTYKKWLIGKHFSTKLLGNHEIIICRKNLWKYSYWYSMKKILIKKILIKNMLIKNTYKKYKYSYFAK